MSENTIKRLIEMAETENDIKTAFNSIKNQTHEVRDRILLNGSGVLKKFIQFCKYEIILHSVLLYLRTLSANQSYKHQLILNDVVEITLPYVHYSHLRKDMLMLIQNVSEGRFKDGSSNLFQSKILSQGVLQQISKYTSPPADIECQFLSCLTIANLSLDRQGCYECAKLSLFKNIRQFVVNSGPTFVPSICWNTLQSIVPLLESEISDIRLFGIYTLKKFAPTHEVQLWKSLCLNSGIDSIVNIRNSDDPLASQYAAEFIRSFDLNTIVLQNYYPLYQLSADLNQMCRKHISLSDQIKSSLPENPNVCLQIGESSVTVNREIVSCRSRYFRALLSTEWNNNNQPICIGNISLDVFQKIIEYLYSAKVDLDWDNVVPILEAADRFGIDQLKQQCEKILLQAIDIETAENLMSIADVFSISELRASCERFIVANWSTFGSKLHTLPDHIVMNLKRQAGQIESNNIPSQRHLE